MSNLFGLRVDLVSRMDPADLANDQDLVEALLGNYTVLGEATNGLSDSVKSKNSDVGWDDPVRLRNRIVHGYWSIELDVLASTAHEDLPQLEAAGSNPASPTNSSASNSRHISASTRTGMLHLTMSPSRVAGTQHLPQVDGGGSPANRADSQAAASLAEAAMTSSCPAPG